MTGGTCLLSGICDDSRSAECDKTQGSFTYGQCAPWHPWFRLGAIPLPDDHEKWKLYMECVHVEVWVGRLVKVTASYSFHCSLWACSCSFPVWSGQPDSDNLSPEVCPQFTCASEGVTCRGWVPNSNLRFNMLQFKLAGSLLLWKTHLWSWSENDQFRALSSWATTLEHPKGEHNPRRKLDRADDGLFGILTSLGHPGIAPFPQKWRPTTMQISNDINRSRWQKCNACGFQGPGWPAWRHPLPGKCSWSAAEIRDAVGSGADNVVEKAVDGTPAGSRRMTTDMMWNDVTWCDILFA